jgi:hypothetical protein
MLEIFLWTVAFALLSMIFTFGVGILLAVDPAVGAPARHTGCC